MENELVERQMACPKCGNRIMDDLVCQDDDMVKCFHCNTEYDPITGDFGIEFIMERK
jgi:hypothetical protein